MARQVHDGDIAPTLAAAAHWIQTCLIEDGSLFLKAERWTPALIAELRTAFDNHPDTSADDFMTKLRRQVGSASTAARQLMAEAL